MTTPNPSYTIHPLCLTSTPLSEKYYEELKADIQANGQKVRILTTDGQIIDGRHRYRACLELNLDPDFEDIGVHSEDYLRKLILSLNDQRRHESKAQRALSYKRLTKSSMKPDQVAGGTGSPSAIQIAAATNVSLKTAKLVKRIADHGTENLQQAVLTGKLSAKTAAAISRKPRPVQDRLVDSSDPKAIRQALAAEKSSRSLGASAYTSSQTSDDPFADCLPGPDAPDKPSPISRQSILQEAKAAVLDLITLRYPVWTKYNPPQKLANVTDELSRLFASIT